MAEVCVPDQNGVGVGHVEVEPFGLRLRNGRYDFVAEGPLERVDGQPGR
jgi:hypothetical protein